MPDAIEVLDLGKRYRDHPAITGVSFSVASGEVVALLGRNGAGKTTTVECIEGYRRPDQGQVTVLGIDPHRHRQHITPLLGVMLQEGGVHQAATPRRLLRLYARFYADPVSPQMLLERLGLTAVADHAHRTLSGGEKQRLSLALALVGRPLVLILDEPTAGMDPAVRRDVWALVTEQRESGMAVLLTTHFMDEAEELADRIGILDRGRLLAFDTPAGIAASVTGERLLVRTPVELDVAALSAAVGAEVAPAGRGAWSVAADATLIPRVAQWFAAQGLPLEGVSVDRGGLEDAFLRLTDVGEQRP